MRDTDEVRAVSAKDIVRLCDDLQKAVVASVNKQVEGEGGIKVNPPVFAAVVIKMAFNGMAGSYGNKHSIEIIQKLVDALDKSGEKYWDTIFEVASTLPKGLKCLS